MSAPDGVAVDGANTIWVSNIGNGSLAHFNNTASPTSILPTFITGAATGSTLIGNDYTYVTTDQSGNVWTTANNEGYLVQYVGLAAPTVSPLAYAKLNGLVGGKPGLIVRLTSAYTVTTGTPATFTATIPSCTGYTTGEVISLSGFPSSTFLNGTSFKETSCTGTSITGTFTNGYTHATTSASEVGVLSPVN